MVALRIELTPTGWRNWRGLALWLAVLALLTLAGLTYSFRMPGKSHSSVDEEPPFACSAERGSLVYAQAARARGDRIQAMPALETIGNYSDKPGSQHYPFPLS